MKKTLSMLIVLGAIVANPLFAKCLPPTNIQSLASPDKKQATIAWLAPTGSDTIQYYQVADWQNVVMWKGTSATQRVFQDQTLPGTSGQFTYYLSTVCNTGQSAPVQYNVNISLD